MLKRQWWKFALVLFLLFVGFHAVPSQIVHEWRASSSGWLYAKTPVPMEESEESRLLSENFQLKQALETLLAQHKQLENILEKTHWMEQLKVSKGDFFKRRLTEEKERWNLQVVGIHARVIYRDPMTWSSQVWIDKGSDEYPWMQKNCPVVMGDELVGMVEWAGKKQSRVRLITDQSMRISVRAVGGQASLRQLRELLSLIPLKEVSDPAISSLVKSLSDRLKQLPPEKDRYGAKGEIYGASVPFWRSAMQGLVGVGFNYDFDDEESLARDLRTGRLWDKTSREASITLIEAGDLLVTTGYEGLFPPGLKVASVSEVFPLQEGASCFQIRAKPLCLGAEDLNFVTVLPPLSKDYAELQKEIGYLDLQRSK